MDITTRKYKFIEDFMRIINSDQMNKLKELENLLYSEITSEKEDFKLTDEQIKFLDEIRARHISGESCSMSLDEFRKRFKDTYGVSH